MNETVLRQVDAKFRQFGLGLVYAYVGGIGDPRVTACVSTVPHDDVRDIMAGVAGMAALRPLECRKLIVGDMLIEGDARMEDLVLWAGATILGPLPMIVACVASNMTAVWAKGSPPMVAYLAARTAMNAEKDDLFPGQLN